MGLLDAATRRRFEELKAQNSPRAALMLRVLDEHTVAEDQYFSEVRFFEEVRSYLIQEDARFVVVSYKLESKNRFKYVLALIMYANGRAARGDGPLYHGLKLRLLSELGLYNRIVQLEKATDFTEPWLLNELQNEPTVTSA